MNTPLPPLVRAPLLELVGPRRRAWPLLAALALGLAVGAVAVGAAGAPPWVAGAAALAALLPVAARMWRDDRRRYGWAAALLGALLWLLALGTLERAAAWVQLHLLRWHPYAADGLLPPFYAEWIHVAWSWGVLLLCAALVARGMHGPWAWALLVVAGAGALEQSYSLAHYLGTLQELRALGVSAPLERHESLGVLGRDGWLAASEATRGTLLARLPALTSAPRVDVQFWWRLALLALLLPAGNALMARLASPRKP